MRNVKSMKKIAIIALIFSAVLILNSGHILYAAEENQKLIPMEELTNSRAANLFQTGDYDQALQEFLKLSAQYPEDPLPARYASMCLILLGRLDEAVTTLQATERMAPENPSIHYFLARAYHEQGNK